MAGEPLRIGGVRGRATLAARRFHAWWEGYAFDPDLERADIADRMNVVGQRLDVGDLSFKPLQQGRFVLFHVVNDYTVPLFFAYKTKKPPNKTMARKKIKSKRKQIVW